MARRRRADHRPGPVHRARQAHAASRPSSPSARRPRTADSRLHQRNRFHSGFMGSMLYIFLIGMLMSAVHDDRVRRLGAHDRGNPIGRHLGTEGSLPLGRRLRDLRLHPAARCVARECKGPPATAIALSFQLQATSNVAAPAQRSSSTPSARATAIFLLLIVIGAEFFCGMASVTANSRMIYAFSRDGAIPGHRFWHKINKRTRTPTNSIWFAAVGAWLLVAPAYWMGSLAAYFAVTAIAVIGLYIAYAPTFLRLKAGLRSSLGRGTWGSGASRWARSRSSGRCSSASC